MKVTLAQVNTTPGDFSGNLAAISDGIAAAARAGSDAVVFPELTIPGYLHQDLIYNERYVDRNLEVLDEVRRLSEAHPRLHIVVGYIGRNDGSGKPFFNMAAVMLAGNLLASYRKQLLPFYDVFDELRYFEPGDALTIVEIAGQRVGIAICEDLWNDKGSDGYNYAANPYSRYRDAGVDVIFSLNSSPFVHDKPWQRVRMIAAASDDVSVVYVNQVGGQDELVFDGHSFVVRNQDLLYMACDPMSDQFPVVDLKGDAQQSEAADKGSAFVRSTAAPVEDLLVLCLRDYVAKSGFSELVLASSGGVDSAVVCALACRAVGADHVHAIRMPSVYSSDHSRADAIELHRNLGCHDYEVPVSHLPVVEFLRTQYEMSGEVPASGQYAAVADENIQARLRDLYVMHFSNAYGAMPLSTGNKTESACGYFTHFDMNFSFAPIKDLYKHQVFELARNNPHIPANIWQKPPSAELAHGQEDEKSLLPYAVLDAIVQAHVEDYVSTLSGFRDWVTRALQGAQSVSSDPQQLLAWLDSATADADFSRILATINRMEYKRRQTCPGIKVTRVAFGIGRRIPIVEKWS